MASEIRAGFTRDLTEVSERLEAVEHGLARLLGDVVTDSTRPLIAEIKGLLPFDPTHRGWRGRHRRRDPGHIRDSIRALVDRRGLAIRTTHPGGPVHWWGGSISPRKTTIDIAHAPGAGDDFTTRKADQIGRDLDEAVGRLLAEHGLR